MRSDEARGPVLVAYRPGGGLLAQAVRDFDHAVEMWGRLAGVFEPSLLGDVVWWIAPNSLPHFAGGEVMDAEQKAARAVKA